MRFTATVVDDGDDSKLMIIQNFNVVAFLLLFFIVLLYI